MSLDMPSILLTPPAGEPVSLADMKAFLRVEHDADDEVIAALIASARLHIETQTRRALLTQTWRLTRDVWPSGGVLPLLPVPLIEVEAVRVFRADGGADGLDPQIFALDKASAPARLGFTPGSLPAPGRALAGIEFDIVAGYGDEPDDIPAPLVQAVQLLVAHWHENRALIGASGEVASVPASVAALIAPFRVVSL
jgi:uncharacterized phiE125 gp8 family phage protein